MDTQNLRGIHTIVKEIKDLGGKFTFQESLQATPSFERTDLSNKKILKKKNEKNPTKLPVLSSL